MNVRWRQARLRAPLRQRSARSIKRRLQWLSRKGSFGLRIMPGVSLLDPEALGERLI